MRQLLNLIKIINFCSTFLSLKDLKICFCSISCYLFRACPTCSPSFTPVFPNSKYHSVHQKGVSVINLFFLSSPSGLSHQSIIFFSLYLATFDFEWYTYHI